ncbi:phosphonate ABC transporter ATP-binding protein [Bacillaceae bacterium S4-13-58]
MTAPTYQYEINQIEKHYGKNAALSSLSFCIEKGEKIALVGPSGAGKSTLLNLMANLIHPDQGEILIDQKRTTQYKAGRDLSRKVGIIRQQFDLVTPLPVIHNVLAGRLGEWGFFKSLISLIFPRERQVAINALKRVGLEEKAYEKTADLSGGQQQRVALARLLVQQPEIILADEPVASLDPARADDVLSMMVKLAEEENQTLLASLHSVDLAKKYFDRIIGLRNGKLFFDLPVEQVNDEQLQELYELEGMRQDG